RMVPGRAMRSQRDVEVAPRVVVAFRREMDLSQQLMRVGSEWSLAQALGQTCRIVVLAQRVVGASGRQTRLGVSRFGEGTATPPDRGRVPLPREELDAGRAAAPVDHECDEARVSRTSFTAHAGTRSRPLAPRPRLLPGYRRRATRLPAAETTAPPAKRVGSPRRRGYASVLPLRLRRADRRARTRRDIAARSREPLGRFAARTRHGRARRRWP